MPQSERQCNTIWCTKLTNGLWHDALFLTVVKQCRSRREEEGRGCHAELFSAKKTTVYVMYMHAVVRTLAPATSLLRTPSVLLSVVCEYCDGCTASVSKRLSGGRSNLATTTTTKHMTSATATVWMCEWHKGTNSLQVQRCAWECMNELTRTIHVVNINAAAAIIFSVNTCTCSTNAYCRVWKKQ